MDEKVKFTEDSYEQAVIKLFTELGYEYECGYDLEDRDGSCHITTALC